MKPPYLACLTLLCILAACAPAPTPIPTPTSVPTATPRPTLAPEPVGDYVPSDIPRCAGVKALDSPLKFDWPGIDDVGEADWFYYRCALKPEEVAAFYREKTKDPPYNWMEQAWVVLPEGTLGAYFHTARQEFLYLWFLSDVSSPQTSYLVVAERTGAPLDLPCH
ncbi:MAG TPA: hypothetical protein VF932_04885 [Anaerolineae bacterium]